MARRKAEDVWEQMIEAWESKLEGNDGDAGRRLAAARNLAARRGWRYLASAEVKNLPLQQIVERVKAIETRTGGVDMAVADAALGLPKAGEITVSKAVEHFYKAAGDKVIGKSEDQLRRHKNPRKRATANFMAAVGDKTLSEITTEDMWEFRRWLLHEQLLKVAI